jgi:hypothetical protein
MSTSGSTMTTWRALLAASLVVAGFGLALAKLPPAPPMNDQQKAAAEEKKAKDAAATKADADALTRAQDRVAGRYIAEEKAKGVTVTPTPVTPSAPAVTTPQGNTPPGGATGQPADAKAPSKTGGQPDAAKSATKP